MVKALTSPEKESFMLIAFQYGDPSAPTFSYYTNRNEDWAGQYISTPALDIELPKNTGVLADDTCTIQLPADAFVDRFTDGLPTSPCSVTIQEVTLPTVIGESASILFLFTGKVTSTIKNKDGRSGTRCFKAKSWKTFFDAKMGVPADHQCPFIFGGIGCESGTVHAGGPQDFHTSGGTIDLIEGHKITLHADLTTSFDDSFNKGYISKDGINIDIREFDGSVSKKILYLTRQPPTSWLGQAITIITGCDKSVERCRENDNEGNYGGVGMGIPAYNPLFEDSPG